MGQCELLCTFLWSIWVGVNILWVGVGECGWVWVGVSGCETFTGGCGLVWVGVGRSEK